MNAISRKEFLCKAVLAIGSLAVLPSLVPTLVRAASNGTIVSEPHIVPTNLKFTETLIPRKLTNLIIVHHVGGTDRDVSAAEIHQWHLANGWAGIGYHFLIHKNGMIEQGRPLYAIGAHCYGYNQTSVGICSAGDFDISFPTKNQIDSASHLIAYLCQKYGLKPDSRTVLGHRDLNQTECPGQNYYSQLEALRKKTAYFL